MEDKSRRLPYDIDETAGKKYGADFSESKHPRDESGKFTSGGGGSKKKGDAPKKSLTAKFKAHVKELVDHTKSEAEFMVELAKMVATGKMPTVDKKFRIPDSNWQKFLKKIRG